MNKWFSKVSISAEVIIGFALVVSIPRMIGAFSNIETDATLIGGASALTVAFITGFGFAVVVTVGALYCWNTYGMVSNTAKKNTAVYKNRHLLIGFVGLQFIMEVLLIWPTLTATLLDITVEDVLRANGMIALWTLLAAALPALVVAAVATSKAFRNSLPESAKGNKAEKANKSGAFLDSERTYECGACGQVFKSEHEGDNHANRFSGHFASGPHKQIMQLVRDGHATRRTDENGKVSFYSNKTSALITIKNVQQQENGRIATIPERTS